MVVPFDDPLRDRFATGRLAGLYEGLGDGRHVRAATRLGLALVVVRVFGKKYSCELRHPVSRARGRSHRLHRQAQPTSTSG